jgi:O-antigen biosynthesis protein
MTTTIPLVSCIMPTRNRGDYVLQSVRTFQRQDYPALELIIVDDDTQDLAASLPGDPRIRYVRTPPGLSIGAKRNRACKLARGEIIAQWDDDDWYDERRLSVQVAPLLAGEADVTGLEAGVFFELERWTFWRCTPELHRRLFVGDVHGGTLVFSKRLWQLAGGYPDRSLAEDAALLRQMQRRGARLLKLANDDLFVYLRHATNAWSFTCGKYLDPAGWLPAAEPPLPAEDREFYARRARLQPAAARLPLVSCIMPTANRRAFVAQALRTFAAQDYPQRELIVVDDGRDAVADLMPPDERIRYLRLPARRTVGAKRNLACEAARGEIVVHWDDDDWSAPRRLAYQVDGLTRQAADICGLSKVYYYDPWQRQAWQYVYPSHTPGVGGRQHPVLPENPLAPEPLRRYRRGRGHALRPGPPGAAAGILPDPTFFVATIHPNNVSPKRPRGARWRPLAVGEVEALLGQDLDFYSQLRRAAQPVL